MSTVPVVPPRFPDPPAPPTPQQTLSRWDQFLGSLATGMPVPDAMLKHYIKRADIETVTRKNKLEMQRYKDAKLAGMRAKYSEFDLEELFDRIAMGTSVGDAFMEVFGTPIKPQFYKLLREDPELEEAYRTALQTKALLEMEKVVAIVDEKTNDTLPGPKGGEIPNMAAVQRARLQFEARHKMAGSWYRRLYGEQKDKAEVTVNINLAERLERGIQNARDRKISPRQMSEAIDATFTPVPTPDTSWMDEKPADMDTTWLEEK